MNNLMKFAKVLIFLLFINFNTGLPIIGVEETYNNVVIINKINE